ncbi:MAG TPA: DUF3097 domain-containing protein [Microbacteriaceae bacterium]|nr:DUF3097 domain-containing protein [Microbacteriaceae bacterium]
MTWEDRYSSDVLSGNWRGAGRKSVPDMPIEIGLVVERDDGYVGAILSWEKDRIELEDRFGARRWFPLGHGWLIDGQAVRLVPSVREPVATPARTASGSIRAEHQRARVARGSRIFVEGRHDAELIEQVWGADLRVEGVVVEMLDGADHLERVLKEFAPDNDRRAGVLLDHLVAGSKESRLAEQVARGPWAPFVRVLGHPYVDVWQSVKPERLGWTNWPEIPRGQDWKRGICSAAGWPGDTPADIAAAWRRIRSRVRDYRDLEPELLGRVEELIDFVTAG